MRTRAITAAVLAAAIAVPAFIHAQATSADRAFVSGGKVDIHLEGGTYEVRASSDNHVRATLSGSNAGGVKVAVLIDGKHADVSVSNTPHSDFKCVIEVPKVSDVAIRLTGGDLRVEEITGSKDIEATAGDVRIAAGNPNNYSKVDASVKVGDLSAGPFGGAKGSFLSKSVNWTGKGTHTLRVWLGAGDLKLD